MKKPDPINKVQHKDEFSSGLMESYGRWMGGDTFQGTQMPELHLSEAPFDGMDPQSNGAEIEQTSIKKKKQRNHLLRHNSLLMKRFWSARSMRSMDKLMSSRRRKV